MFTVGLGEQPPKVMAVKANSESRQYFLIRCVVQVFINAFCPFNAVLVLYATFRSKKPIDSGKPSFGSVQQGASGQNSSFQAGA
jgi:hypothetical protein